MTAQYQQVVLYEFPIELADEPIVDFFQLSKADRQSFQFLIDGYDSRTMKSVRPGSKTWKRALRALNWYRFLPVFNNYVESEAIYLSILKDYKQCHQHNICAIEHISIDQPIIPIEKCDYRKIHVCPGCRMILEHQKFEPYYIVSNQCCCSVGGFYEFDRLKWQPSYENQSCKNTQHQMSTTFIF